MRSTTAINRAAGLLLRTGDVDGALQMLIVEEDDVLRGPAVPARAYAAAMPPRDLWAVPSAVARVADVRVATVAGSGDDGRAIAACLGAVLAARQVTAGRNTAAAELTRAPAYGGGRPGAALRRLRAGRLTGFRRWH